MSDSLFNTPEEPTKIPSAGTPASPVDTIAYQLMDIKNERGEPKYHSLTDAINALKHSQEYIPQLKSKTEQYEAELAQLKAELAKRDSVEDVIARLSTQRQPEVATPTSEAPKALDEAAVEQMLQRVLTQREKQELSTKNISAVRQALVAKFGDKAADEVKAKAEAFGMSMEQITNMSATSPSAVLAWFNATSPASSTAPVRSTVQLPESQPKGFEQPKQSMLRGVSGKDQEAYMRKIREEVYRENDIDL